MKLDTFYVTSLLFLATVFVWQLFSPIPSAPFAVPLEKEGFIEGYVASEPTHKETYIRYEIIAPKLFNARIVIYDDVASLVSYGDTLIFTGKLTEPKNNSDFDWVAYLARQNIFYEMRFPKVAQSDTVSLPLFVRIEKKLLSIKYIFSEKLSRVIYEPAATLAAGELLGEKRLLSKELDAQLKIAGVSHIVVLSGYNITIVSESIMRALSFLPRMYASYAALFGIFIFVAGAGFSASVLRAALMASILLLSRKEGAEYSARRALLLVAVVMVLFKPPLLLYDASFQLSFLATAGILWGQKYFEKKCSRITNRFTLRETLATTLSAQVAVFPLLIHLSGGVQLYSIVANMLILPVVPAAMFTAFVTILAGFFSYHLSFMFGICTAIILSYQIIVVSTIAALPWAHIPLPHILSFIAGGLYILFFVNVLWKEEN